MKKAFTLAEVLITLGVIGVVAAMTIPTLASAHKKHELSVRLKNFYSTVKQAERLANEEYGDAKTWEIPTAGADVSENKAFLEKHYMPYIKGAQGFIPKEETPTGKYCIELLNGSAFCLSAASVIFYPDSKKAKEKLRETNVHGRDYFTFNFYNETIKPRCSQYNFEGIDVYSYISNTAISTYGKTCLERDEIISYEDFGCHSSNGDSVKVNALCTLLIKLNNWEIPRDYPIKF